MQLVEKFISINGEGTRVGELAMFLRFKGCNLRCSYCDTMWANEADCPYKDLTPEEIRDDVLKNQIRNVTITGGEPLLQKDMKRLLSLLLEEDHLNVEIETNGAVDLSPFEKIETDAGIKRPVFTMDYKLPSSGCEEKMLLSNFEHLKENDTVKFVSGSIFDMDRARELIEEFDLTHRCHVYYSPIFGSIEPKDMVNYMIEHKMNDVRLQIQVHKVIWDPNERGV